MKIDGNTYIDMTNAYRLDQTGGIGTILIGANETYINVTTPFNGTPVATTLTYGVKTGASTGATTANGTLAVTDARGNTYYLLKAASA